MARRLWSAVQSQFLNTLGSTLASGRRQFSLFAIAHHTATVIETYRRSSRTAEWQFHNRKIVQSQNPLIAPVRPKITLPVARHRVQITLECHSVTSSRSRYKTDLNYFSTRIRDNESWKTNT